MIPYTIPDPSLRCRVINGTLIALLVDAKTLPICGPERDLRSLANERVSKPDDIPPEAASRPVLIVDDEPIILDLLRDVLQDEGFTVITANNGAAALYLIERTPVALVLTDLMMPFVSGIDLAQQLHSNPQTAGIPLLLMSAVMPRQVGHIFAAVIHKPFEVDAIVRIVRQFLPK
jgi:CheY-like chemotaxis protein